MQARLDDKKVEDVNIPRPQRRGPAPPLRVIQSRLLQQNDIDTGWRSPAPFFPLVWFDTCLAQEYADICGFGQGTSLCLREGFVNSAASRAY